MPLHLLLWCMENFSLPPSFDGFRVHLVGIKGTGMTALAEYLLFRAAVLSGSDTDEQFYTDGILKALRIPYAEHFSRENIAENTGLVVYSSAYDPAVNPELIRADELGIPCITYTEALGMISQTVDASGISGVHGKTTTTALAGTLVKQLGLPCSVIAGSAVANFGGRSTLILGDSYFIAETCEYKRHFLSFQPDRIVITSVEPDHLDYFSGFDDILAAFVSYGLKLPEHGELIYCADDEGACRAAELVRSDRPDIVFIPYGEKAEGDFRICGIRHENERSVFSVASFPGDFVLRVPGKHTVLNAVAALALTSRILLKERAGTAIASLPADDIAAVRTAFEAFSGSKRRSEFLGEAGEILFFDDYAHHPTAVRKTLEGFREFYPERRIVADFMSHTYSRTKALFDDFAASFAAADIVIMHRIYASAREKDTGTITGLQLAERTRANLRDVRYFENPVDAYDACRMLLKPGDLFITLGAGDNWKLGRRLFDSFSDKIAASDNSETLSEKKEHGRTITFRGERKSE